MPRHVVELLLPLYDNDGRPQPRAEFARVRRELVERFGGLTAHVRAPVEGFWQPDESGTPQRDDLLIFEVVVDELQPEWWAEYRRVLERRFRQESLLVRATAITQL